MNYIKPRGTEDIYEDINLVKYIENILIKQAKKFNFDEVRTPLFEDKNLFFASVGLETDIVSKEMFYLEQKGKKHYVLRPEGTAPIARFIIENKIYKNNNLPLKLFYLQSMFRYERPQLGRFRQFNQFGVEIIGIDNYFIDIETILFAISLLEELKIQNYSILINSIGSVETQKTYQKDLISKLLDQKKCEDCEKRLKKNPLRVLDCKIDNYDLNKLPKIYDYLTETEKKDLNNIIKYLKINKIKVVLDYKLVRGLDYYTGTIFEIIINENTKNPLTLIAGGRYNNLYKKLSGNYDLPAIGFGLGIERIKLLLLQKKQELKLEKRILDAFFISLNEEAFILSLKFCQLLRKKGLLIDMNFNINKNLKQQFKIADKFIIKNIIIIGENEIKNNFVTIKQIKSQKSEKIEFNKILKYFEKDIINDKKI